MRFAHLHAHSARRIRAFTLVEVMIATTTLVIVIGSVIMCNLFGMSMAVRQQIWLSASDDAARCVATMMSDVRAANTLQVGTFSGGVFTQVSSTAQQSGNALLIYTNTSTNQFTLYYYSTSTSNLVRSNYYSNGTGDSMYASANAITNDVTHPIFTEVDYTGTAISNQAPVAPINLYLSFIELQDPQVVIESGSSVDLYQIITTVSPRIKL